MQPTRQPAQPSVASVQQPPPGDQKRPECSGDFERTRGAAHLQAPAGRHQPPAEPSAFLLQRSPPSLQRGKGEGRPRPREASAGGLGSADGRALPRGRREHRPAPPPRGTPGQPLTGGGAPSSAARAHAQHRPPRAPAARGANQRRREAAMPEAGGTERGARAP